MKFGRVQNSESLDVSLPKDNPETFKCLSKYAKIAQPKFRIGLPKWGKPDLENFYPKCTKNPLLYYSSQFNSIELNAFFYRIFKPEQVVKWRDNTTVNFTFNPKIPQIISQFRRLKNVDDYVDEFLFSVSHFNEKLGTCFLQMHPTFAPSGFADLQRFVEKWPKDVPLAVELRHSHWYDNQQVNHDLISLLNENNVAHIITDTVGRRDLIHMQLTNCSAFIRFTADNSVIDEVRIDRWIERLKLWHENGLQEILFFAHIHAEKESPFIPALFVNKMNAKFNFKCHVPNVLNV